MSSIRAHRWLPAPGRLFEAFRVTMAMTLLWTGVVHPASAMAQNRSRPPIRGRERPLVSVEGAGLVSTVSGDALGSAGDGAGFDALIAVGNHALAFAAGYQWTSHALGTTNTSAVVGGPFVEPRATFTIADGNVAPYLFARASYLTRHVDSDPGHGGAHGTAFGGGVGTLIWLAPNLQLNTDVMWQDLRFDRTRVSLLSVPVLSSRVSGSQWSLRAGLVVGLGGWR